jgi:hypothetical protein
LLLDLSLHTRLPQGKDWRSRGDPLDLADMDKNKRIGDPYAEREAQRYSNPIPSREFILDTVRSHKGPCTFERLLELLGLNDPQQREALERRLTASYCSIAVTVMCP